MGPWKKYYNIVHIGRFCRGIYGLFERASIECGKWDLFGEVKKGWVWKREKFQRERNGFPLHVCTTLPACYLLMASRHRSWRGYLPRFVSSTSGSDAAAIQWLISLLMIGNLFKRQKYFLGKNLARHKSTLQEVNRFTNVNFLSAIPQCHLECSRTFLTENKSSF